MFTFGVKGGFDQAANFIAGVELASIWRTSGMPRRS